MKKPNCDQCSLRNKHDKNPKSFLGRFWRWHINFCSGWKTYLATLDEDEKKEIIAKYNLSSK